MKTHSHLLIDAAYGKKTHRAPVWMMRQAGRYLPEYRKVREKHDFITMYKTPELATEVTLQPVDIVGVDAAIIFSDILVIPEAMGMELLFTEGKGPSFPSPLRQEANIERLKELTAEEDLKFVMDALSLTRKELNDRVPLIGFSGAPWTLAAYMVEGQGSKTFKHIKEMRYARPELLHRLLQKIADAVVKYCTAQVRAGAQILQLFESWGGLLDEPGFEEFAQSYVKEIIQKLRPLNVPIIYFVKGGMAWLEQISASGADVVSLDWTIHPSRARKIVSGNLSLQGNLDPTALYSGPDNIRRLVKDMLSQFGSSGGYIANLGHGILPDVPVSNAKAFVESVKEESEKLYALNQ